MTRRLSLAVTFCSVVFTSSSAFAQTPAVVDAPNAPSAEETPAVAEAREHHRRGLELSDEGDYKLALVEFERAYALTRSFKVLYNIGQVQLQLTRYAKARLALEQYLRDGGDAVPAKRRSDVERDLAMLRTRTATLSLKLNVPEAEVTINDVVVSNGGFERSLIDAGALRLVVSKPGYVSQRRDITLAGGDVETVSIELSTNAAPQRHESRALSEAAIISWIATGALTGGAVVTGVLANGASSKYDRMRVQPHDGTADEALDELGKQRRLVNGLALTTDILAGAAVVGAGVSLYFTLKGKSQSEAAPQLKVSGNKAIFSIGF